jgi:O-antigen ligase
VLFPELWKRPILGFGYQAFWLGLKGESANVLLTPGHASVGNAENGLLQMWLELGGIGTALTLFLLIRSLHNATVCLAHNPSRFIRWNCAIIFLSLLGAINGQKFMYPDTIEWVLFVLAYINLAEEKRRNRMFASEVRALAWAS